MKHQKRRTHAAQDAVGIGRVLLQMKVHIPAKKRSAFASEQKSKWQSETIERWAGSIDNHNIPF
ncbi:MAG: hypothetical protein R3C56_33365 [Pirellulaceae bacterium]